MNGVLIVDKPNGVTSHDVVQTVRHLVGGARVGHAGTLDPNATGVLLILVGKATKVSRFLMGLDKEYVFTAELGVETDTLDRWGKVVRVKGADGVRPQEIVKAAERFKGRYQQIAPSVSALKHRGVPLYKLARGGKPTPIKTRVVVIKVFEVIEVCHPYVTIRVICSSGTYVRSLARDMGEYLGCGASIFCLRRMRIGDFGVEQAIPLNQLLSSPKDLEGVMLTIEDSLKHLPTIRLKSTSVQKVRSGGQPSAKDLDGSDLGFEGDYVALTDETGIIIGIARRSRAPGSLLRIERIL